MDRIIGDSFFYKGKRLTVKKVSKLDYCKGCFFSSMDCHTDESIIRTAGDCNFRTRLDETNVIFV